MFKTLVVKSISGDTHTTTEVDLTFVINDEELIKTIRGIVKNGLYIATTYGTFISGVGVRTDIVTNTKYIYPDDIVSVEVKI